MILDFALNHICPAVRQIALKYFRQNLFSDTHFTSLKQDGTIVTIADREIEEEVSKLIKLHFADDLILGEEQGLQSGRNAKTPQDAKYLWLIDPIDGTVSFKTGRATFCFLLGVFDEKGQVFSLCYQPITDEIFYSAKQDTFLLSNQNGNLQQLQSNAFCKTFKQATIATCSPAYFRHPLQQKLFNSLQSSCGASIYGGDAYLYCQLAMGGIDIVMDCQLAVYDIAPMLGIIQNSGNVVKSLDGNDLLFNKDNIQDYFNNSKKFNIIACNKNLHTEVNLAAQNIN